MKSVGRVHILQHAEHVCHLFLTWARPVRHLLFYFDSNFCSWSVLRALHGSKNKRIPLWCRDLFRKSHSYCIMWSIDSITPVRDDVQLVRTSVTWESRVPFLADAMRPGAAVAQSVWNWAWSWRSQAASPLTASPSLVARTCGLFKCLVCVPLSGD